VFFSDLGDEQRKTNTALANKATFEQQQVLADRGDPKASLEVARMMCIGKGTVRDHAAAIPYFQRAAEGGIQDAMYRLARAYSKGEGIPQDISKALEWGERAARPPSTAKFQLFYGSLLGTNPRVVAVLHPLANDGNAEAQYLLSRYYRKISPPQPGNSRHWLDAAVSQGHGNAINDSAIRKLSAKGNREGILQMFEQAAEAGSEEAFINLGQLYSPFSSFKLPRLEKDSTTAERYFREAAKKNHLTGTVQLATLIWRANKDKTGTRGCQLRTEALEMFKWAADKQNTLAQLRWGNALITGTYCRRNLGEGLHYLVMAGKGGSAMAMERIAELLEDPSSGVRTDHRRAERLKVMAQRIRDGRSKQPRAEGEDD
jgi:TPR repeat protein